MKTARAILRAFDSAAYLADVQLLSAHATYLQGIAVAPHLAAADLVLGRHVALILFDDANPNDAAVVAVLEGTPGGISLSYQTAALAADVTMSLPNTWYLGPSLVIGVGTWLVSGGVVINPANGGGTITTQLSDGATIDGTEDTGIASGASFSPRSVHGISVVASGTKTIGVYALCSTGGASTKIKATGPVYAVAKASTIVALKIA